MSSVISIDRSIIPACDVNIEKYEELIKSTCDIAQVGGYKISASLAVSVGLRILVEIARRHTKKALIYDHQKAGTDIPDTGKEFVEVVKQCGIDALILFPFAGPATQTAWIKSAHEVQLPVIVGGHMTHERFLASEGGYIDDKAVNKIYETAALNGVTDYVVPGNKPQVISKLRTLLKSCHVDPIFYAPGFIAQGGSISDAAKSAGPRWHAIVGRAIYESRDMRKAALSLIGHIK